LTRPARNKSYLFNLGINLKLAAMFAAGFYLATGWMLEGLEAMRRRNGDGLILERPAIRHPTII